MHRDRVAVAVAGSARRFHAAALATGPAHHVASPLGAWLLLAVTADALVGDARDAAGDVLGMPVDDAGAAVDALLAEPHPAVAAAMACWTSPSAVGPRLGDWSARLPAPVERGPAPSAAAADRWAADRTDGLVERFPVTVDARTALVLASALATRVTWEEPFAVVEAAGLGGPWASSVERALGRSGSTWLADSDAAGRVVVTAARSEEGLVVLSVGADPAVAPEDVIAAALVLGGDPDAGRVSLFDVPTGPGHSWDLLETTEERATREERVELASVVLPAWRATSDHRLLGDDRFGFTEVVAHLLAALPPHPAGWEADAGQTAVAAFGRLGFEAAAVTAVGLRAGAGLVPSRRVPVRTLAARLAHPHAVVAVATGGPPSRWHGLPVFSAWVADPTDPWD